jgi:hypothetical protein
VPTPQRFQLFLAVLQLFLKGSCTLPLALRHLTAAFHVLGCFLQFFIFLKHLLLIQPLHFFDSPVLCLRLAVFPGELFT